MRVVLDTNTVVSAIGWTGTPRRVLLALHQGRHMLVTSPDLLDELARVLAYPKLRTIASHPLLPIILEWLHRPEHVVLPRERLHVVVEDTADDCVLEAAVAGRADVIVSGDRHLLALVAYRGIPIVSARVFADRYL